jgi:excisionase family DNA binding protein
MTVPTKKLYDIADLPRSLTTRQVAELLGVHPATPRQWRHLGRGPAFVRLAGGGVRYEHSAVFAWIEAHTVTPGGRQKPVAAHPEAGPQASSCANDETARDELRAGLCESTTTTPSPGGAIYSKARG